MKIGIEITTYNRLEFTKKCLNSLFWSKPKNTEIVIIDNNSTDGTVEFLKNKKKKIIKEVIFNDKNMYLGYAVVQGWNVLKDYCDILGWINNDFLFEPGWEENVISCFSELNIDYICGLVNLSRKQKNPESKPMTTISKKGHFVESNNVGAAYFIKKEHFLKNIYPNTIEWSNGYTGPGPSFHNLLNENNLKGIKLLSPGILILDPEYTKNDKYYNEVFSIRGLDNLLEKFKNIENNNKMVQGINWLTFLLKYYPNKIKEFK